MLAESPLFKSAEFRNMSAPCINRCQAILVTNVLHLGATVNREQGLGLRLEGMLVWRRFTNNSGLYTSAVPVTRLTYSA